MPARRILTVLTVVLATVLMPVAAAAAGPGVGLSGAQATAGDRVSVVARVSPLPVDPLTAKDVAVTSAGSPLAADVGPVLSSRTSLVLVVDSSAQAAESTTGGGLSGVASFLLQAPAGATVSVVADQAPPVVAATPSDGVSAALAATSTLRASGARATSSALGLALKQSRPGLQTVVVLYTAAPQASGEQASDLAGRIVAAHAVLAVVTTSGDDGYWSRVAQSTGGLAISASPANAISAFDRLADELRSRYLVTFPRPHLDQAPVTVRVETAGGAASASLRLPAGATPAASATAGQGGGGPGWWLWILLGALLVAGCAALAVWWWREPYEPALAGPALGSVPPPARASPSPPPPPPAPAPAASQPGTPFASPGDDLPPPLPGVRLFDVGAAGAPKEIAGSLFEPRTARDARLTGMGDDGEEDEEVPGNPPRGNDGASQ